MKIHEYQARELLVGAGIPVPPSVVVEDVADAGPAFDQATLGMKSKLAVVKAQVHAGGRGKAGFVKLVKSRGEAEDAARFMLGNRMISVQTGPEGVDVKKLLVGSAVDIAHEYYLAITTDRSTRRNVLIASREGGMDIETVAHERPEAILKQPLHPTLGLQPFAARKVAFELGFTGKLVGQAVQVMMGLAKVFEQKDCSLAEINPLVVTKPDEQHPEGRVVAIDAKFTFDDNGLFRHPELLAMEDPTAENPYEVRAHKAGLSYVALEGNIGCLVNGAGLAMSTMDIIKLHGGQPANFLDVGGSASEAAVTEAFRIILSDTAVKGVLVNIFGGIMKCDIIAQGIINAAKEVGFKVPLVVRLEGTNVDAGRKLLESARGIIPTLQAAGDLGDAAKKVCAAVN